MSLVRTFSLRYWLAGLGERSGPVARSPAPCSSGCRSRSSLSLSLGDERVVLARKPALVTKSPNGAVPGSQARAATS